MDIFTNREIALAIWLAGIIIPAFLYRASRKLIHTLLKALLQKQIIILIFFYFSYVAIAALCLESLGLWDTNQIKNTVVWALFVGITSTANAVKNSKGRTFFKDWIFDQIKIIVLIEYLVSIDSFSLVTELIFIPITFLVGIIATFSKHNDKSKTARKICENLLFIIGLIILGHALNSAWNNYDTILTKETLKDFYTPIALSISLLPFLYGVYIYSSYERILSATQHAIRDKKLGYYASFSAAMHFRSDIDFLDRWRRKILLETPTNKLEVRETIKKIQKIKRTEKNPPSVAPEDGWSPYTAQKFLEHHCVICRDYHEQYDEWFCGSNMLEIGDGYNMSNNIAYYINGTDINAKELSLILNVNNLNIQQKSEELFYNIAMTMLKRSVDSYPEEDLREILDNENTQAQPKPYLTVSHTLTRWENGNGYTRNIRIAIIPLEQ